MLITERLSRIAIAALVPLLVGWQSAQAVSTVSIDAAQVGGFYGDGAADNAVTFQNYFVGYGTTPGSPRTEERRSFFSFDLSGISGTVTDASFSLQLKDFGVIFGKDCAGADPCTGTIIDDPGTPGIDESDPGTIPTDPFEEFVLGLSSFSSAIVTDTSLPATDPGGVDGMEVFEDFAATPVAGPFGFSPSDTFDFSTGSAEIVLSLTTLGIAAINDAIATDGDLVLTGFMPTFSFEDRMTPGGSLVELDELLFGLTDIVDASGTRTTLLSPFLEVTVVPLPAAAWVFAPGLMLLFGAGRRRQ